MSDAVLADTDVFSFAFRGDPRAKPYERHFVGRYPCLAFQTVAELRLWAIVRQWGAKRIGRLDEVLKHYVVLPYDPAMAVAWATIVHRRGLGRPIQAGDAWVAASAVRHKLPLLTHNRRDFADIPELQVLDAD